MEAVSTQLNARLRAGQTVAQTPPDFSGRTLSQDQRAHHERFKAAAAYAKAASRSNPIYAQLAAGTVKNAYNLALQDWFNPPVIHRIERAEGRIRIRASDNVMVTGVQVMVLDEAGEVREKGEGIRGEGDWWEYVPAAEGKVVVEARDLAGNVVRALVE